jgi:hypothetical protein
MLSFRDFSEQIITTGDIDPDYILIREKCKELGWNDKQKFNWILHKLVIYDSYSELDVIINKADIFSVKYGTERRKSKRFAQDYLNNIQKAFIGTNIKEFFSADGRLVFKRIKSIKGFGSWAAWKFMDLMSCCYDNIECDFDSIDFRQAYTFPLKGLLMINNYPEDVKILKDTKLYKSMLLNAYAMLEGLDVVSPHNNNKGIRLNELETLLCKYHSYKHKKYKVGQDIEHLKKRSKECII